MPPYIGNTLLWLIPMCQWVLKTASEHTKSGVSSSAVPRFGRRKPLVKNNRVWIPTLVSIQDTQKCAEAIKPRSTLRVVYTTPVAFTSAFVFDYKLEFPTFKRSKTKHQWRFLICHYPYPSVRRLRFGRCKNTNKNREKILFPQKTIKITLHYSRPWQKGTLNLQKNLKILGMFGNNAYLCTVRTWFWLSGKHVRP